MRLSSGSNCLLPIATALTVLLVAITPAQAAVTPGVTRISATSSDLSLVFDDGSMTITCPTAELTAVVSADGRGISGTYAFSSGKRRTCQGLSPLGTLSVGDWRCGLVTLRSVASTAGVSASFDLAIDGAPSCVISIPGFTDITFDPQAIRSCLTFTQVTQSFTMNCSLLYTSALRGSGMLTLTATFSVNRPRLSLS